LSSWLHFFFLWICSKKRGDKKEWGCFHAATASAGCCWGDGDDGEEEAGAAVMLS
jgi:hypothetical protein